MLIRHHTFNPLALKIYRKTPKLRAENLQNCDCDRTGSSKFPSLNNFHSSFQESSVCIKNWIISSRVVCLLITLQTVWNLVNFGWLSTFFCTGINLLCFWVLCSGMSAYTGKMFIQLNNTTRIIFGSTKSTSTLFFRANQCQENMPNHNSMKSLLNTIRLIKCPKTT